MEALVLLAVLVCPLVMGGMMLWMMRGTRGADRSAAAPAARKEAGE